MRLLNSEIKIILETLQSYSHESEVYLHGSRIDNEKKGGDIDLFLILADHLYDEISIKKHYLLSELSLKLSEQKIDIVIIKKSEKNKHSFFLNSQKIKLV